MSEVKSCAQDGRIALRRVVWIGVERGSAVQQIIAGNRARGAKRIAARFVMHKRQIHLRVTAFGGSPCNACLITIAFGRGKLVIAIDDVGDFAIAFAVIDGEAQCQLVGPQREVL